MVINFSLPLGSSSFLLSEELLFFFLERKLKDFIENRKGI